MISDYDRSLMISAALQNLLLEYISYKQGSIFDLVAQNNNLILFLPVKAHEKNNIFI